MKTTVQCEKATHGVCKLSVCVHFQPHEPQKVGFTPCTTDSYCFELDSQTHCKLVTEN